MTILQEIKLLAPKVIQNSAGIVEGITTDVKNKMGFTEDSEAKEIATRRSICEGCSFNNINASKRNGEYEKLIKNVEQRNGITLDDTIDLSYKSNRIDLHCSLCGCNVELKTSCLSCTCGIEQFNNSNNTTLMPKWFEFKK